MAALVAFDEYRHHSAEAGAKYILTALFSSGLLLLRHFADITVRYGTLYLPMTFRTHLDRKTVADYGIRILLLPAWDSKFTLVPFHLWTADVYEGAPTVR